MFSELGHNNEKDKDSPIKVPTFQYTKADNMQGNK